MQRVDRGLAVLVIFIIRRVLFNKLSSLPLFVLPCYTFTVPEVAPVCSRWPGPIFGRHTGEIRILTAPATNKKHLWGKSHFRSPLISTKKYIKTNSYDCSLFLSKLSCVKYSLKMLMFVYGWWLCKIILHIENLTKRIWFFLCRSDKNMSGRRKFDRSSLKKYRWRDSNLLTFLHQYLALHGSRWRWKNKILRILRL